MKRMRNILLSLLCAASLQISAQQLSQTRRLWIEDVFVKDTIYSISFPDSIATFELEISAAMSSLRDVRGENHQSWLVKLMNDKSCVATIQINWGNSDLGAIDDSRYLQVSSPGNWVKQFTQGVSVYNNDNALVISSAKPGEATVSIGNEYPQYAGTLQWDDIPVTSAIISATGSLNASYISFYATTVQNLDSRLTLEQITELADNYESDTPVGIWRYLDRDTDTDYARPGGTYTLAVVPRPDGDEGEYLIIYLDGATVNSSNWKSGMIKGLLQSTAFTGTYFMKWISSHFESAGNECHASLDQTGILTLNFPLLKSQLRFTRQQ